MSASKEQFITLRGRVEDYTGLPPQVKENFEIRFVDEEDVDYSQCPQWVAQKKVSDREFRKLKNIEYDYRHNNIK